MQAASNIISYHLPPYTSYIWFWPESVADCTACVWRVLYLCRTNKLLSDHLPPKVRVQAGMGGEGAASIVRHCHDTLCPTTIRLETGNRREGIH